MTKEEQEALEAKLAAEQEKNRTLLFNQRVQEARSFIDKEVNGGKAPRLTNVDGVAEFMAQLDGDDAQTFEFSAADDKTETAKPSDWFKNFLKGLPEQSGLTQDFSKDDDSESGALTSEKLAEKALDYVSEQAGKGLTISVAEAVTHIQTQQGA